jgi:hypothetical protein
MRLFVFLLAVLSLISGGSPSCFAQRPSGPPTLEPLVTGESASSTAPDVAAASSKRQGVLARPTDQAHHADLDKAWQEYDTAVVQTIKEVQAAIQQQFDASAAEGDLDAAELWQKALDDFSKRGLLPTAEASKPVVDKARAVLTKAQQDLGERYAATIKALTMSKDITLAKAVREEWRLLEGQWQAIDPRLPQGAGDTEEMEQGDRRPAGKADKWVVLFRSKNPAHWNRQIDSNGSFAMPLKEAPAEVRFLRLKRESNDTYVIVGITNQQLETDGAIDDAFGWAGTCFFNWNGHHLGIYGLNARTPRGQVAITVVGGGGGGDRLGWGFGHRTGVDDRQCYSWAGSEIPPTVFEIAVKGGKLTASEKKHLLGK